VWSDPCYTRGDNGSYRILARLSLIHPIGPNSGLPVTTSVTQRRFGSTARRIQQSADKTFAIEKISSAVTRDLSDRSGLSRGVSAAEQHHASGESRSDCPRAKLRDGRRIRRDERKTTQRL
jgi:hypothetical protein